MRRIAAALIVLATAGCSAGPEAQRPPERRIARPPVVRSIAVSPAQYVARASSASLFAIKASRLVASRSSNAGLASFARQVEAEQEGVGSQLSFAGSCTLSVIRRPWPRQSRSATPYRGPRPCSK